MTSYYDAVQYPWLEQFNSIYNALLNIGYTNVPADLQPAYAAALKTGGAIDDEIQAGTTIDADTVNEWMFPTHNLVMRIQPASQLATQTAQPVSNSTPYSAIDQSIIQPIETSAASAASAITAGASQAFASLPWPWIGLAVATVVIVPALLAPGRR